MDLKLQRTLVVVVIAIALTLVVSYFAFGTHRQPYPIEDSIAKLKLVNEERQLRLAITQAEFEMLKIQSLLKSQPKSRPADPNR